MDKESLAFARDFLSTVEEELEFRIRRVDLYGCFLCCPPLVGFMHLKYIGYIGVLKVVMVAMACVEV